MDPIFIFGLSIGLLVMFSKSSSDAKRIKEESEKAASDRAIAEKAMAEAEKAKALAEEAMMKVKPESKNDMLSSSTDSLSAMPSDAKYGSPSDKKTGLGEGKFGSGEKKLMYSPKYKGTL